MKPYIKSCLYFVLVCSLFFVYGCSGTKSNKTQERVSIESEILYADPTIYAENGKYYLAGTRNVQPDGFVLLESTDLNEWKHSEGDTLLFHPGDSYGTKWFWAPQILKEGDEYWLTYSANEQTSFAKSNNLNGPYKGISIDPIDGSEKNIDSFLFKDDDGKWYLYHVRFDHGNFLWVAEFDPTKGTIIKDTLRPCFRNDQDWENTDAYPCDPIMEGPTVIKLDDKYYLFYSANHYMSPDYAVGYAVSDSPTGPWLKNPGNPIIHKDIVDENGSGHGDIFKDNEGNFRYVYHVHNSDSVVAPRRTRIVKLNIEKNEDTGIYNITADRNTIIRPRVINQ